jgi:predicted DNA-binding transcriptional regulator AlpA
MKHINNIDLALKNFDQLPDTANVRLPTVMGLYGVSSATIWRQVRMGTIPQPRKLTPRTTVWKVKDLRDALSREVENG